MIPYLTFDGLSDAEVAALHGKLERSWHSACAVFAQIDPVSASGDFRRMSGVITELSQLRSMTYMQLQARAERFTHGYFSN